MFGHSKGSNTDLVSPRWVRSIRTAPTRQPQRPGSRVHPVGGCRVTALALCAPSSAPRESDRLHGPLTGTSRFEKNMTGRYPISRCNCHSRLKCIHPETARKTLASGRPQPNVTYRMDDGRHPSSTGHPRRPGPAAPRTCNHLSVNRPGPEYPTLPDATGNTATSSVVVRKP